MVTLRHYLRYNANVKSKQYHVAVGIGSPRKRGYLESVLGTGGSSINSSAAVLRAAPLLFLQRLNM
jgi:hypothetical protein